MEWLLTHHFSWSLKVQTGAAKTGVTVSAHLQGIGDRQPHDTWTESLSGYDSKQSSKCHNEVSYKLQANCQPPEKTQNH